MAAVKPKGIQNIESRMLTLEPGSFRFKTLEAARDFKRSWIALGQYLFAVHKDKLYRDWGYLTFEAYAASEVGIRQGTAMKLLRSYQFLEKEEPAFLKQASVEDRKPNTIPSYESVNALRLAKQSERIPVKEYEALREEVLEEAKEDADVKKKIRYILKSNPVKMTPEEKENRKDLVLKRSISSLKNVRTELVEHSFPKLVLKKLDDTIDALENMQP